MKTKYIIKDITYNLYYWSWHATSGFDILHMSDIKKFNTKEEALKEMKDFPETFENRDLQIIEVITIN